MLNLKLYPAKSQKVRWIERKDQGIILNPKTGIYHKLNQTATYIWQISNGTKTMEEISDLISDEYNIKKKKARQDVYCIINYLKKAGIVELFRSSKRFCHV